jgi:3,4-dihydroxy 2-butanone 4-phosphate synthase
MRSLGGGLISVIVSSEFATLLGLPLEVELYAGSSFPSLRALSHRARRASEEAIPRFSISVDEIQTITGISDEDRTRTIVALAKLVLRASQLTGDGSAVREEFLSGFVAPGHVRILIASEPLMKDRCGHSESAIALCVLAGLPHIAVTCEMVNSKSARACSLTEARRITRERSIPLVMASRVKLLLARYNGSQIDELDGRKPDR